MATRGRKGGGVAATREGGGAGGGGEAAEPKAPATPVGSATGRRVGVASDTRRVGAKGSYVAAAGRRRGCLGSTLVPGRARRAAEGGSSTSPGAYGHPAAAGGHRSNATATGLSGHGRRRRCRRAPTSNADAKRVEAGGGREGGKVAGGTPVCQGQGRRRHGEGTAGATGWGRWGWVGVGAVEGDGACVESRAGGWGVERGATRRGCPREGRHGAGGRGETRRPLEKGKCEGGARGLCTRDKIQYCMYPDRAMYQSVTSPPPQPPPTCSQCSRRY